MPIQEITNQEILQEVRSLGKRVESVENANGEILQAINNYTTKNDQQWGKNEERWQKNDERLTRIEATMVTKDYLDDKLSDLKGDLVVLMRKEDAKLGALVEILQKRKVISNEDVKTILAMQPFPHLYV